MTKLKSPALAKADNPSLAQARSGSSPHALWARPVQRLGGRRSLLQAKLSVGQPDEAYEQEADRVADQVMRMPDPAAARPGIDPTPIRALSIQRLCPECEEEEKLRRLPRHPATGTTEDSGLDAVAATLRQTGRPLDLATRAFFEPRFGVDFSAVRIHTDAQAAASARAVNALAYTVGRNVVFNSGQYAPHTDTGRRLLAHELSHTVQQTGVLQRQAAAPVPKLGYDDCTPAQQAAIATAFTNALAFVRTANRALIAAVSQHPRLPPRVSAMLTQHFHTTDKNDIITIQRRMGDIQAAMSRGIDFECETSCDPGVGGYVWKFIFWEVGDVHICFNLFNQVSQDIREEIVMHEIGHRHVGLDDEAYSWQPAYAKLSAKDAMDNADSYAAFARRL